MVSGRTQIADVDAMLARWRAGAGADWQAAFRGRLEAHGRAFRGQENPLDAWAAILLARALDEAPPAWTMDYLATCAAGIYDLRAKSTAGKSIEPAMIGRALGMVSDGRGTAFPRVDAFDWIAIAVQVRDAIKAGINKNSAWDSVATANRISKSKVREAWLRLEAQCPEISLKK